VIVRIKVRIYLDVVVVPPGLLRFNIVVEIATLHIAMEGAHRRVRHDGRAVLVLRWLLRLPAVCAAAEISEVLIAAAVLLVVVLLVLVLAQVAPFCWGLVLGAGGVAMLLLLLLVHEVVVHAAVLWCVVMLRVAAADPLSKWFVFVRRLVGTTLSHEGYFHSWRYLFKVVCVLLQGFLR